MSPLFIWGVLTTALSEDLGVSEKDLASVFSVGLVTFTVGVLVGGSLVDTVAPRPLALVAGFGVAAGLGVSAVASSVAALTAGFGVLLGGGAGLGYATAVGVAGTVGTRRGASIAAVVSAYAAGAVVLAPLANRLLVEVGRTGALSALTAGMAGLVVLAAGLLPTERPSPPTRSTTHEHSSRSAGPIAALWLMSLLGSAPALVAFAHPSQFQDDSNRAVLAVVLLNAGNLVGRLVSGPIADRLGLPPTLHVSAAALTLACTVLAATGTTVPVLASYLVIGVQYGAISVLAPLATAELVPARMFGRAYGKVFTAWGAAGLLAPPAAVWLAERHSYRVVAGALLAVAVLGWFVVLLVLARTQDPRASSQGPSGDDPMQT